MNADFSFDGAAARRIEQVYLTQDIIEQRRATRALLRLRPGETVLDVGCGPGFLLAEMAEEVGAHGKLSGIDASADMIARARQRCQGIATVTLQEADALAMRAAAKARVSHVLTFDRRDFDRLSPLFDVAVESP